MIYAAYFKRPFDILLAAASLVLLLPVWILIFAAYAATFSFPVFYRQVRLGKNEKEFSLIKFRTLKTTGASLQDRRFFLGDILRMTSLDELPQLLLVLTGTMSCIGPRPLPAEYKNLFSTAQRQRHSVRPGITGYAQVSGRNSIPWTQKLSLDVFYAGNVTFLLDLKIIFKTVVILFSFKKDVSLNEGKFTGEN